MKIIVCVKVVPDEELIEVQDSRELKFENVPTKISQYDLNALEAARQLAKQTGGSVTAVTVGPARVLEPTKIRKDILSRGVDVLKLIVDDIHDFSDSMEVAKALAAAIREIGEYDLILCGTGSSDLYEQVTGVQLGALLDIPTLNNVSDIIAFGSTLTAVRALETSEETFEVPLPAVIATSSEINMPPVPAMMDIIKAGKKPADTVAVNLGAPDPSSSIVSELAPEDADRRKEIIEGDGDEQIEALAAFLKKEIQ